MILTRQISRQCFTIYGQILTLTERRINTMDAIIRFLVALNLFQSASDHYKESKTHKKYNNFYQENAYIENDEYNNQNSYQYDDKKRSRKIIKRVVSGICFSIALLCIGLVIFINLTGYLPWQSKASIAYGKANTEMAILIKENITTYHDNTGDTTNSTPATINPIEEDFENKILGIGISPATSSDIDDDSEKEAVSNIKTKEFSNLSSQNKMNLIKDFESKNTQIANILKSQNQTGHIIIDKQPDYQSHIDAYNTQKDIFNNALNDPKTKKDTQKIDNNPLPNY